MPQQFNCILYRYIIKVLFISPSSFNIVIIISRSIYTALLSNFRRVKCMQLVQTIIQGVSKLVLITYKTRAHAQLSVTLIPQAVSQTFRHI